jgi:hypothetical protein
MLTDRPDEANSRILQNFSNAPKNVQIIVTRKSDLANYGQSAQTYKRQNKQVLISQGHNDATRFTLLPP